MRLNIHEDFQICISVPLRKEINTLLSKRIPNIYLKVTIQNLKKGPTQKFDFLS